MSSADMSTTLRSPKRQLTRATSPSSQRSAYIGWTACDINTPPPPRGVASHVWTVGGPSKPVVCARTTSPMWPSRDHLVHPLDGDPVDAVVDREELPPDLGGDGEHAVALGECGRQRLFAHDVFSRAQRLDHVLLVQVVGQEHANTLDGLVAEELGPTAIDARNVFSFGSFVRPCLIDVENAHYLDCAGLPQCLEVDPRDAAHT